MFTKDVEPHQVREIWNKIFIYKQTLNLFSELKRLSLIITITIRFRERV